MNIFISANDNYIYAARVMLTSFFTNNPYSHTIYFLYSSVSQGNILVLEQLVRSFGATFIPTKIDESLFQSFASTERFPVEVYFRLLIASIAPKSETRALWLDVDLVVNGSLADFYAQNIDGYAFAACRDIGEYADHLRKLSCSPDAVYVNSGVILFNLERMRNYRLQDFHSYYLSRKDFIVWPDQDILNGMFCGQIKVLDCDLYNVQVSNWRFHNQYDLNSAAIIHFIGNSKPWFPTYTNAACRMWDHYHRITFCEGPTYLLSRRLHRILEKYVHSPFRTFRAGMYRKYPWIKKLITKRKT